MSLVTGDISRVDVFREFSFLASLQPKKLRRGSVQLLQEPITAQHIFREFSVTLAIKEAHSPTERQSFIWDKWSGFSLMKIFMLQFISHNLMLVLG